MFENYTPPWMDEELQILRDSVHKFYQREFVPLIAFTISAVVSGRSCTRTPEARSCQRGAFVRSSVSIVNTPQCR